MLPENMKWCLNCKYLPNDNLWCGWRLRNLPSWVGDLDIPAANEKAGYIEDERDSHRERPYLKCPAWEEKT